VAPNYTTINAAEQESDPGSCLNYFRKLVALRKHNLVLVYGKYTLLNKSNPKVYAYTRGGDGQKMLVVLNFSATSAKAAIGTGLEKAELLLSNYAEAPANNKGKTYITLRPYEALIYKL
jgi:oligo-1,6-glucosidase